MKILFLSPYPKEGASNRLRIEQYFPYLKKEQIIFSIRPFYSKKFYLILYKNGNYLRKAMYFFTSTLGRLRDLCESIKYDIIFIHREAFPIGPPWIENIFSKFLKKMIIFDFDDAIYLPNTSKSNRFIGKFKQPKKTIEIIKMSKHVIAGNLYLKNHVLKYNKNITVIPTVINNELYKNTPKEMQRDKALITIGWIGSVTTVNYLNEISGELKAIDDKYSNLEFIVIGGKTEHLNLKRIIFKKWALEEEINELKKFDIGIMPMPDNQWSRGKCGFKAILYMSMGIPTVASKVGVNSEILVDGQNGFLAKDSIDWIDKLSILIENPEKREKLGMAARKTVEEKYSVNIKAPEFVGILKKVYHDHKKNG